MQPTPYENQKPDQNTLVRLHFFIMSNTYLTIAPDQTWLDG